MRLQTIRDAWDRAFFAPQSPAPLGLYRILFGLLVIAKLVLLGPDWLEWFGVHGWVTLETMHKMEGGLRLDVFDLLPSDTWIQAFFWMSLLAAASMTVGLLTRFSTVLVFLSLVSIDERELYAMNSGDTYLRVACFFLMFAPTEAAFSVDRLVRVWRGKEAPEHKPQVVWTQRLLQYQMALVYFVTAWWKANGVSWVDGTALYYVQHLDQFRRFPLPGWVDNPVVVRFETWFGLAEEFALGTLVWIEEFRYWVLAVGVGLHLMLEYSMNVPLFQWVMLATFVLFVDGADMARAWAWVRRKVGPRLGPQVRLFYDAGVPKAARTVNLLRALDVFSKLEVREETTPDWRVETAAGRVSGRAAWREVARAIPALWPFGLLFRRRATDAAERRVAAGSTR